MNNEPVALTQVEIMNALTLGIPLYLHPVKELTDEKGRPMTYWGGKAHPVKELHLSLQKSKQTGELLAVTYTDDEHRIVEVLWQKPSAKEQEPDLYSEDGLKYSNGSATYVESLEKKIAELEKQIVTIDMNNEPVAWINRKGKDGEHGYLEWDKDDEAEINTPLYLHPAKELTDEEIWDFINALCLDMGDYWELTERNAVPMIRAILRKASGK